MVEGNLRVAEQVVNGRPGGAALGIIADITQIQSIWY